MNPLSSKPGTVNDRMYSVGGALYWQNTQIAPATQENIASREHFRDLFVTGSINDGAAANFSGSINIASLNAANAEIEPVTITSTNGSLFLQPHT